MSRFIPRNFSTFLSGYLVVSISILCGIILISTYFSASNVINHELTKSFDQRHNITSNIIEQEAERLDRITTTINENKELLHSLSTAEPEKFQKIFENYADTHESARCDILFFCSTDSSVHADISSPVPDVNPFLSEIANKSRLFLKKAGLFRFMQNRQSITGIFKSKKLILDNGAVPGIIVTGTVLNDNLTLLNRIKRKTDSALIILTDNGKRLAATTDHHLPDFTEGTGYKKGISSGKKIIQSDKLNLIFSHYRIRLNNGAKSIGIVFGIDDDSFKQLDQSYLATTHIIIAVFALFLLTTLIFIKRLIYPAIKRITDYTKAVKQDREEIPELKPGAISELNTIGSALETMVHSIAKAQSDLKLSEKRYRLIADNVADVIWTMDLNFKFSYISPSVFQLTGYTAEEAIRQTIEEKIAPDSIKIIVGLYKTMLNRVNTKDPAGLEPVFFEAEQICKDGSTVWTGNNARILLNEAGNPSQILGVSSNIADRKRAEKALRENEKKFRNLFELSMDAIFLLDPEKGYLDCNKAALKMFCIDSKIQFKGLSPAELSPEFQPDGTLSSLKAEKTIAEIMEKGSAHFEWKHRRLSGDDFDASVLATRITINERPTIQGSIRDISDYKRGQEMMVQSEKMLSVGGLAAGMAHEINNPLAGIMQTANVMSNRLQKGEKIPANVRAAENAGTTMKAVNAFMESRGIFKMLDTINDSGVRVAEIVNNMLSFSRKSEGITSSHNPVELVDKALKLASADYDLKKKYDFKTIAIKKEYDKDLPHILCEEVKMQQVLFNILRNGAQAMQEIPPEKKILQPEFKIRLKTDDDKSMLRIEIEDNGPGMDEATRKKVFEPFFTTKPVGTGTGLGLSVSYFIITESHKGSIDLISEPGKGTTFIIKIPIKKHSG